MSWAWGRHPRNGFGYKAKDSLAVEVTCLYKHVKGIRKSCSSGEDFLIHYRVHRCEFRREWFWLQGQVEHVEVDLNQPSQLIGSFEFHMHSFHLDQSHS